MPQLESWRIRSEAGELMPGICRYVVSLLLDTVSSVAIAQQNALRPPLHVLPTSRESRRIASGQQRKYSCSHADYRRKGAAAPYGQLSRSRGVDAKNGTLIAQGEGGAVRHHIRGPRNVRADHLLDCAFTPTATAKTSKAEILVQSGIHSGEIEGKDTALMLARDTVVARRSHQGGMAYQRHLHHHSSIQCGWSREVFPPRYPHLYTATLNRPCLQVETHNLKEITGTMAPKFTAETDDFETVPMTTLTRPLRYRSRWDFSSQFSGRRLLRASLARGRDGAHRKAPRSGVRHMALCRRQICASRIGRRHDDGLHDACSE